VGGIGVTFGDALDMGEHRLRRAALRAHEPEPSCTSSLRRAELGYWVGEEFWGRGIATEAVSLMVAHTWRTFPAIQRIFTTQFGYNQASARVVEHNGFVFEGRLRDWFRKEGKLVDCLMYAKLRGEAVTQ
jgi:ribosomal-protein-alanine N-acetyltransferase